MDIESDDLRIEKRRIAGQFRRTVRRLMADMEDPTPDVTEEVVDEPQSPNERTEELLDTPIRNNPAGIERLT